MPKLLVACLLTVSFICAPATRAIDAPTAFLTRHSSSEGQQSPAHSIDEALWWLPEDTQTVSVARGPFRISTTEPSDNSPAREFLTLGLRRMLLGNLAGVKDGSLVKRLEGQSVLFILEGSRKFRAPKSLGGMLFEGCSIIVLEQNLDRAGSRFIDHIVSQAIRTQNIAGNKVAVFEERLEEDFWKFLIAAPSPNVLLCATNEEYLTQVITRMNHKAARRALPQDLPEWKQIDTNSAFWSVRHYDPVDAKYDPSSPLHGKHSTVWSDDRGVGIVFEFDPSRPDSIRLRYLSNNENARKILTDEMFSVANLGKTFTPKIHQIAPGVIEIEVSLKNQEQIGMFFMILFFALGHGVYV